MTEKLHDDNFDNRLIFGVIYQGETTNIHKVKLLIWRCHLGPWELMMCIYYYFHTFFKLWKDLINLKRLSMEKDEIKINSSTLERKQRCLWLARLIAAKRLIARWWKSLQSVNIRRWLLDFIDKDSVEHWELLCTVLNLKTFHAGCYCCNKIKPYHRESGHLWGQVFLDLLFPSLLMDL